MGTAVNRACAGVSCLGTLPWSGTYSDLRVYASEEEDAAIGAMGLAGERAVWTPEKEATLAAWYEAETSKFVYGVSPLIAEWNPTAGSVTGNLTSAGALQPTSMPPGVRFQSDSMVSSAAAAAWPLHKAAGCSIFYALKLDSAATCHLGGTALAAAESGIYLLPTYGASYTMNFRVFNGSGVGSVNNSSTATWAAGDKVIIECHLDSTGWAIGINGSLNSGALFAALGAGDATYTLRMFGRADTGFFGPADGTKYESVIYMGRASAGLATKTRRYLGAKHGIVVP